MLEPSVLQRIEPKQRVSIERVVFPAIVADGGLYAMATDDYWIDTGKPELFLTANLDVLAGLRRHDHCDPVHPQAIVDSTAEIDSSIVGDGATVRNSAILRGSVVLSGADIGAGAVVVDSVVMGSVGDGAHVHNVVIGRDGSVAAGEHVRDERRPDPDNQ